MNEEIKLQIRRMNQRIKELDSIYHTAANQIGVSDGEITVWSVLLTAEQSYSQQELCDLRVRDVFLKDNPHVLLRGKGGKSRYVPIVTDVAHRIAEYLVENRLDSEECKDRPLFFNQQRQKLTRAGVSYIVAKYANSARLQSPNIPTKITPHIFRHTKAMHLCQAGIDIIYIRDILGHVDLATTEIYARLNIELLRDALENAYPELPTHGFPEWENDDSLMRMLNSL